MRDQCCLCRWLIRSSQMRFYSPRLVQPGIWCWTWIRRWIMTLKSLPLAQMLMLEIYTSIVIHSISIIFLTPVIYHRSERCNYATNRRSHELCQNNSSCSSQTLEIVGNYIRIDCWPQTRVIRDYESHIERIDIGERKLWAIIYTTIQHVMDGTDSGPQASPGYRTRSRCWFGRSWYHLFRHILLWLWGSELFGYGADQWLRNSK